MAHAKRTKLAITKEVPAVELTLTDGEVDFLLAVLARVGGSPVSSPRKYGCAITAALQKATGLKHRDTDAHPLATGSISFSDYGSAAKPASINFSAYNYFPRFPQV